MPTPRLRVAICGGGISGLCLAVALSRHSDIQVDIYEAAGRFAEIGAGVMIWSRTWRILELMGLADAFSRVAHAPQDGATGVGFDFRRSDMSSEGFRFYLFQLPHGCIRFHRAHFLDVFVDHLPNGVAKFDKRLSSYDAGAAGPITLRFADGTSEVCDLLVGCDGIKSTVRSCMLQSLAAGGRTELLECVEPVFSGTVAYRGLIPIRRLSEGGKVHRTVETPMMYCGKGKHVVSYSISQGTVVNVVALVSDLARQGTVYDGPWVSPCSKEELLACYARWEPEVKELLDCIETPTKWALHALKPLSTYVTGNVALVGDAAHAMLPHQGAGAGQAIEDAFILASLLGDASTNTSTLAHALKIYENIRLPKAHHVLNGSRESAIMYEFNSSYGDHYETLGPAIKQQWGWLEDGSPEEDVRSALDQLRQ